MGGWHLTFGIVCCHCGDPRETSASVAILVTHGILRLLFFIYGVVYRQLLNSGGQPASPLQKEIQHLINGEAVFFCFWKGLSWNEIDWMSLERLYVHCSKALRCLSKDAGSWDRTPLSMNERHVGTGECIVETGLLSQCMRAVLVQEIV